MGTKGNQEALLPAWGFHEGALVSGNHGTFTPRNVQTLLMNPRRAYTLTLSLLLLVEGVWGLFSPVVFGVLATNTLHAVIHIALGIVGIWAANTDRFRGYLLFIGFLLLTVGALWFVPGIQDLIIKLLNVNHAVAAMNIVVGIVSLLMGSVATPYETRRPK